MDRGRDPVERHVVEPEPAIAVLVVPAQVWIDPEGRALLWRDENGELVRQHIGQGRTQRIALAPASAELKEWQIKVSPDGKRIARIKDARVVFTHLRRRAPGPA